MSGKTWLAEFYPETAREAAERGIVAAGKHCLQKWLGFTPEALKKHHLHFDKFCVGALVNYRGEEITHAGPGYCAYCQALEIWQKGWQKGCKKCPLAHIASGCYNENSPYREFINTRDPSRLIAALRKALFWVQAREEEANSSPGA